MQQRRKAEASQEAGEVSSPLHTKRDAEQGAAPVESDSNDYQIDRPIGVADKARRRRCPPRCRFPAGERGRGRPGCCVSAIPLLVLFFSTVALLATKKGYFHQYITVTSNTSSATANSPRPGKYKFHFGWLKACYEYSPEDSSSNDAITPHKICQLFVHLPLQNKHWQRLLVAGGYAMGALHFLSAILSLCLVGLHCAGFWDSLLRAPWLNYVVAVWGFLLGGALLVATTLFPAAASKSLKAVGALDYLNGDFAYTFSVINSVIWAGLGFMSLYGLLQQRETVEELELMALQEETVAEDRKEEEELMMRALEEQAEAANKEAELAAAASFVGSGSGAASSRSRGRASVAEGDDSESGWRSAGNKDGLRERERHSFVVKDEPV